MSNKIAVTLDRDAWNTLVEILREQADRNRALVSGDEGLANFLDAISDEILAAPGVH